MLSRINWSQLEYVLSELIKNAYESLQQPSLTFKPDKKITLRVGISESSVEISVIDNGIRLPQSGNYLQFFTSEKASVRGHGLGLPIVQRLVAQMGGTFVLGQSPSGEKTATVTLPIDRIENISIEQMRRSLTVETFSFDGNSSDGLMGQIEQSSKDIIVITFPPEKYVKRLLELTKPKVVVTNLLLLHSHPDCLVISKDDIVWISKLNYVVDDKIIQLYLNSSADTSTVARKIA